MFKSIRIKLILSYILLIIISISVTGLFLQRSIKKILEEELIRQVKYQSETYADLIHSRISGPDDFILRSRDVVGEFLSDKRQSLKVYDLEGKIVGTSLFNVAEILDWNGLMRRLKEPDNLACKRIWDFLDEKSRNLIENWNPGEEVDKQSKTAILNGLDKILDKRDFYTSYVMADIIFSEEAQQFINMGPENLEKGEVRRLNRLLFELIFPDEIAQSFIVPELDEESRKLSPDKLERVKKGETIHWYETNGGRRILHVAAPIKIITMSGSEVIGATDLAAPLTEIDTMYQRLTHQLLIAVAMSAVFTLLISIILAQTLTRPIFRIRKMSEQIAHGDFSVRVKFNGKDEIRSLADTINYMADQIEANITEITGEKDKMNALLSVMPDGVVALDDNGEILFLNSAALTFTGIEETMDVTGKKLTDLWQEKEVKEFLEEGANKSGLFSREIAVPPRILKLYLIQFGDREKGVSGILLIIRDVTDIRRLEETRTKFLSSISHELRTPLTIIKGWIYTILDEEPIQKFEGGKKALEIMNEETDRLTRLVNELLELSRLRSKKLSFEMETVKVDELVSRTFDQIKKNAERMNVKMTLEQLCADTEIPADKDRIKQVVINLIDNAIKYTPGGGDVVVRTRLKDGRWILDVEDTGLGISKDELPFLFERFFRTKDRKKKKYIKGTGLGMAIVKEIVDAHKGKITVDSEAGKGTRIHIAIPMHGEDEGNTRG